MRRGRVLALAGALLALAVAVQAALVITAAPMRPLRVEPLLPDAARAPTDDDLELARQNAPWILHDTDPELGRQDIPTAMDFDGDLDARNNWESLPRRALVPTVYYTVARSETHVFLTYHLYHPRDWTRVPLGIQEAHEGDGESVQVVVEKATSSPVLLTTQAHYRASSYAPQPGPILSGRETLRADFEVRDGHPVVYAASGGHGIYGSRDPRGYNPIARATIVTYRPPAWDETVIPEPATNQSGQSPYRLVSLPAFLENSTAEGGLFAGSVDADGRPTPRYHAGDRYSGPLGPSRGMSPFSLAYRWSDAGALFWNPAAGYADALDISGNWSRQMSAHPFWAR